MKNNNDYQLVTTPDQLQWVADQISAVDTFAFDLETTGFNWQQDQIVGWALSWKPQQGVYIPVHHTMGVQLPAEQVVDALKPVFESTKTIVAHNVKFDSRFVWQTGIDLKPEYCEDTLLEAFVAAEGWERFGLKELVEYIFKHRMVKFDDLFPPRSKNKNIATVQMDIAGEYACEDADYSLRLHTRFFDRVRSDFIYKLERRLWPIVQKIEDTGVLLDGEYLTLASRMVEAEAETVRQIVLDQVEQACGRRVNFAINSSKQLGQVLYDIMKIPAPMQTKSGANSTAELALEQLASSYPVCRNILTYRSMKSNAKTLGETIIDHVAQDGRIHTQYNQAGAPTGRFASSNPNLQNIGKKKKWDVILPNGEIKVVEADPREGFVAQEGYYLIELDFKQIEFICMAAEANDEVTIKAYLAGEDVHKVNATIVFAKPLDDISDDDREATKTCSYLMIYGGSAHRLHLQTRIGEEEAERRFQAFFKGKPKFTIYMQRIKDQTRKTKFGVTKFGRRIPIPEYQEHGRQSQAAAERKAINVPIQGVAADIHKMGLILSTKKMESIYSYEQARMVLQTHDSQTWEVQQSISPDTILPVLMDAMSPHLEKHNYPRIQVDAMVGISWSKSRLIKYKPGMDWVTIFAQQDKDRITMLDNLRELTQNIPDEEDLLTVPTSEEKEVPPEPPTWHIKFYTGRELENADALTISDILKAFPGENVFVLCLPNGQEAALEKYPTSLTAKAAHEIFTASNFPHCRFEPQIKLVAEYALT